jgi:sugar/nucleoside kinase (ribokinase family)
MNYWIARKPERVMDVLRRVDVALLNEEEARALSGETQLVRAAGRLVERGGKAVIVKKGEHGSLYRSKDQLFIIPAFPVSGLQDPTGAGDSFAGGFLGWLARSGSLETGVQRQAMAFGTAMASLAIEAFSPARLIEVTPEEIARRVATLHQMVDFELEPSFP